MKRLKALFERIRKLFRRKPDQFLTRLGEQSALIVEGSSALVDYMGKPSKKKAGRVRELEKQADEVRRIFIDELNRSFVTPIDREDLFALSRAIDDVLDHAYVTTNEMDILDVSPNDYLKTMAEMLNDGAEKIHLAIERLEHHPKVADGHAVSAKAIENRMETLYAEALAELFNSAKSIDDVVTVLKLREIYRHMFHAVGSVEQAANIINDIVVKFF